MSNIRTVLLPLALIALALGHAGHSLAYSCSNTALTTNDGCFEGSAIFDTPGNISLDDPFGITDWVALDTSGDGSDDLVEDFIIVHDGSTSGTWSITIPTAGFADPWDTYSDLMITMQGGLGNYVAYSLTPTTQAGTYLIVGASDLDHMRLWGSGTAVVPVPAALWLFASGLFAVTAIARRKKV